MKLSFRLLCVCLALSFCLAAAGCFNKGPDADNDPPVRQERPPMPDPGVPTESPY